MTLFSLILNRSWRLC